MSGYFRLSEDDARRLLRARDSGADLEIEEFQEWVGDGEERFLEIIMELRAALNSLRSQFPEVLGSRDPEGGRFEQQGCVIVHQCLEMCPTEAINDPSFWIWLAVAQFADTIEWRFGAKDGTVRLANYGVGNPAENMMFRMWLRGEIGRTEDSGDPYELAKTGDQDLWRSHIIRQGYGSAREIARALLRLQAGKLPRSRLDNNGVRELAKRLKRIRSNVFLECLSAEEADALILEQCDGL